MNERIFQNVFDNLQDLLPASWMKVVFYAGYTAESYGMKFYVDTGDGQYIDCFNIPGLSQSQLITTFIKINEELSSDRDKQTPTNRWNIFTMTVDSQGMMHTDFDYTNIEENTIAYERKWKEKYLH